MVFLTTGSSLPSPTQALQLSVLSHNPLPCPFSSLTISHLLTFLSPPPHRHTCFHTFLSKDVHVHFDAHTLDHLHCVLAHTTLFNACMTSASKLLSGSAGPPLPTLSIYHTLSQCIHLSDHPHPGPHELSQPLPALRIAPATTAELSRPSRVGVPLLCASFPASLRGK